MLKRKIVFTNQFKRDLKRMTRQGRDEREMFVVVEWLANDTKLADKYRDHALTGNYKGYRECHIAPDWLLIYKLTNEGTLLLVLTRTGTHNDLF